MSDMMIFPSTWEEFEKIYGFEDSEEIYTNKSRLIPSFRVKQWLEHEWTPCSNCLPNKGLRVLMQLDNSWQIVGWYDKEDEQWYALPYEEPIDEFTYAKVIAWMPLPKYEGKE